MDLLARVAFVAGLAPDVARARWAAYLDHCGLSPDAAYARLLSDAPDATRVLGGGLLEVAEGPGARGQGLGARGKDAPC